MIPGLGRSPGGGHGNPPSTLAWRIPWTEEPGGLQSMGSQRVGHDLATKQQIYKGIYIYTDKYFYTDTIMNAVYR